MTSTSFRGGPELRANIRDFRRDWDKRKAAALRKVGHKILAKAEVLVPRDGEDLADSGRVVESAAGKSVTVVFGDKLTEAYALAVHDHPSDHSPESWKAAEASGKGINWSEPGTGPGFLMRPFAEEAGTYLADLGEELRIK